MKKSTFDLFIAMTAALLLFSCADTNTVQNIADASGVHGFWWGLWNGMTIKFSFVGSLFSSNISVYDVHNNGGWYNFGFLLGAAGALGGAAKATSRR